MVNNSSETGHALLRRPTGDYSGRRHSEEKILLGIMGLVDSVRIKYRNKGTL